MNLEDESNLSAYLDDELDPPDRLAVEWSVESSQPLADQLRSIALARDAVAGLDRPSIPRDLAPALGARIASNRRRARLRSFARPAQIAFAFSSSTAIAASLVFALIRLNQSLHESPAPPAVVIAIPIPDASGPASRPHPIEPSVPPTIPAPRPATTLVQDATGRPPALPTDRPPLLVAAVAPPAAPAREAAERGDRRVIGGILDRPHVRRILIVTDVIDAADQVRDLIRQDARETPEFGRISIRQEIIVDPDHPEAAEVYAVPIDERGRRSFVDRLRRSFPDLIDEGRSSPDLVTHLSEVGQVAVLRGVEAAPLGDPPHDLPNLVAHREPSRPPFLLEADRAPRLGGRPEGFGSVPPLDLVRLAGDPASRPPSPSPDFVGPPDPSRLDPPRPGERVTLIVWVTRPDRR